MRTQPRATSPQTSIDKAILGAYQGIDPYPLLRAISAQGDTALSQSGILYVTSYDLATSLLRSGTLMKGGKHGSAAFGRATEPAGNSRPSEPGWLTTIDDPDHRRIRAVVSRAFDFRSTETMTSRIDRIAVTMLNELATSEPIEIMAEFALKYPTRVIDDMVGIRVSQFADFVRLAHDHQRDREPGASEADRAAAIAGREQIYAYIDQELSARPEHGVAATVLAAEDAGLLDRRESATLIGQLYLAGFHSPGYLLGTALCQLAETPALTARLRESTELMPRFVNESLRYDTPLMTATYKVLQPMTVDGSELDEGAAVSFLLGAANHDARVFSHPEKFDIDRDGSAVLSFSSGLHNCLAGHLTRTMTAVALTRIVTRFRAVEYVGAAPPHSPTFNLRGRPEIDLRLIA